MLKKIKQLPTMVTSPFLFVQLETTTVFMHSRGISLVHCICNEVCTKLKHALGVYELFLITRNPSGKRGTRNSISPYHALATPSAWETFGGFLICATKTGEVS